MKLIWTCPPKQLSGWRERCVASSVRLLLRSAAGFTHYLHVQDCLSSDFCAEEANSDTKVLGISVIKGYEPPEKDDEGATTAFPVTESERLLCIGATIAREIRAAIFQKLGYTCSTGVACNKLLAKLGSPLNKPDGQAVSISS